MPVITDKEAHKNVRAFLDLLAYTEGTDNGRQKTNAQGYDVIVGGSLFTNFDSHPNVKVKLREGSFSTAAGRYQLLSRYWMPYACNANVKALDDDGFPDFKPITQDRIAIQQIRERGALQLLKDGKIAEAISRTNNIWASLPGSPYGQRTESLAKCKEIFISKGGEWLD